MARMIFSRCFRSSIEMVTLTIAFLSSKVLDSMLRISVSLPAMMEVMSASIPWRSSTLTDSMI